MRRGPWPRGLRARMLVACVAVTVLGTTAAAWTSTRAAGAALVHADRHRITRAITDQIDAIAPELTYPPDRRSLDRLRAAVGGDAVVTFRQLRSATRPGTEQLITDDLRAELRAGQRIVTQQITAEGRPWLLVGTPVLVTAPDGARTPSGIEVYAIRDLADVERQVDRITLVTTGAAALTLPFAVLLALLAARSVLRPVRDLRDTARRLANGDLGARSPPRGADELAELTGTINEMAESVQASVARMRGMQADARRFAADVSHELRTPLSTLTAVVEVLMDSADQLDPDARQSAHLAITETARLVRLVEELMEVSRLDAGTARLHVEEVEAGSAVRDCLRARDWLDRVELTMADEVVLRVDRRRLDVIVANLVGNALRHGAPPVRIRISRSPEHAEIEVTDGGPGLPEHVLPHVFDRFYKADAARSRAPGSGLGLAIALANARLHGGDIAAGRAAGGGARFVLTLPYDPLPPDPEAE